MTHHTTAKNPPICWFLWDAGELSSVHPTRADASAAREHLLAEHLIDFPSDRDDLEAALMIEPTAHNGPDTAHPQDLRACGRNDGASAVNLDDHGHSHRSSIGVRPRHALAVEEGS